MDSINDSHQRIACNNFHSEETSLLMGNERQVYYYYDEDETPESGIEDGSSPPSPETIAALTTVSSIIEKEGRERLRVSCPFCKITMTTTTQERTNEIVKDHVDRLTHFGVLLITCVFLIGMVSVILLFYTLDSARAVFGVSFLFLVIIWFGCQCTKSAHRSYFLYSDLDHYCSNCETVLGTSNGYSEMLKKEGIKNYLFF